MDSRIQHQDYYLLPNGIECIDVIKHYSWCIGSAMKYLWRHGKKQEQGIEDRQKAIEDLRKAIVCIEKEIEQYEQD